MGSPKYLYIILKRNYLTQISCGPVLPLLRSLDFPIFRLLLTKTYPFDTVQILTRLVINRGWETGPGVSRKTLGTHHLWGKDESDRNRGVPILIYKTYRLTPFSPEVTNLTIIVHMVMIICMISISLSTEQRPEIYLETVRSSFYSDFIKFC